MLEVAAPAPVRPSFNPPGSIVLEKLKAARSVGEGAISWLGAPNSDGSLVMYRGSDDSPGNGAYAREREARNVAAEQETLKSLPPQGAAFLAGGGVFGFKLGAVFEELDECRNVIHDVLILKKKMVVRVRLYHFNTSKCSLAFDQLIPRRGTTRVPKY